MKSSVYSEVVSILSWNTDYHKTSLWTYTAVLNSGWSVSEVLLSLPSKAAFSKPSSRVFSLFRGKLFCPWVEGVTFTSFSFCWLPVWINVLEEKFLICQGFLQDALLESKKVTCTFNYCICQMKFFSLNSS